MSTAIEFVFGRAFDLAADPGKRSLVENRRNPVNRKTTTVVVADEPATPALVPESRAAALGARYRNVPPLRSMLVNLAGRPLETGL